MSLGEALKNGGPVVFTRKGDIPSLVCAPGKEAEALKLLDQKGIIRLMELHDGNQPVGTIKTYSEKVELQVPSRDELLAEAGWVIDCESPFEITHPEGSSATGLGAICVVATLRQEWMDEHED